MVLFEYIITKPVVVLGFTVASSGVQGFHGSLMQADRLDESTSELYVNIFLELWIFLVVLSFSR